MYLEFLGDLFVAPAMLLVFGKDGRLEVFNLSLGSENGFQLVAVEEVLLEGKPVVVGGTHLVYLNF